MSQARFYNKWTFKKFSQYLKGEILEVGCGIGNFSGDLSKYGNVTAIDIDQKLIKQLTDKKNVEINAGFGDIETGKFYILFICKLFYQFLIYIYCSNISVF